MVTCKLIGRTGNQMFQIAATIGFAKLHGLEYHIPPHTANDKEWPPMFTHLQNKNFNPSLPLVKVQERGFNYTPLPAPPSYTYHFNNIELNGYFQSEKYFEHCIDEIKSAFNIPYKQHEGWTAIHVRLGDYKIKQDFHPIVTQQYLLNAVNILIAKGYRKFQVFSDELDGAYELLNIPDLHIANTQFNFTEGTTEFIDLAEGSSCDNIIGSNSSFSLWMYYLNPRPEKIGIFPRKWFGPKMQHDTRDLYPKKSIII